MRWTIAYILVAICLLLTACDSDTTLTVCPVADYPAYCRHEAVFCALTIAEYVDETPVIVYGELVATREGHVECYLPESRVYVRMTYFGVYLDPEPRYPMVVTMQFTVAEYLAWGFGWAVGP